MLVVETDIADGDWDPDIGWAGLAERACAAALDQTSHGRLAAARYAVEVSVRFTGDDEVRKLNAGYRSKDKPTNVLSFPMVQRDLLETLGNTDDGEALLGDIVLAAGVVAAEAAEKGVTVADHASHLVVHGMLHLLGYDHESEADGDAMERLEVAALATLGLADPYASDR